MTARRSTIFLFAAVLASVTIYGAAQDGPSKQGADRSGVLEPKDFGVQDEGITYIGYTEFLPPDSLGQFSSGDNERWATLGGTLYAPVIGIPDGATLTQIVFYIRDDDAQAIFNGRFNRAWVDSSTGQNAGGSVEVELHSVGAPGESVLSTPVDIPIRYRFDVDDDGTQEVVHYYLRVSFGGGNGTIAIRGVRLTWRRNVSPAPGVATFGDVPTNHLYFQFIEALAASGITVGCQANPPLYCPDRTLTRGEMAVYLAKALGLHWSPF